jgi:hypothetical protein
VPGLRPAFPLQPDDDQDPDVFRIDLTRYGIPPARVAFSRDATGLATAVHTDLGGQPWSLVRAEPRGRAWQTAVVAGLGIGAAVVLARRTITGRRRGAQP